jgi:hypothetical protein
MRRIREFVAAFVAAYAEECARPEPPLFPRFRAWARRTFCASAPERSELHLIGRGQ